MTMRIRNFHIHHKGPAMRQRIQGFTLIELMIVVAIVAILVTIAVASYDFAVIKARRSAATGCAMEVAQGLERYYTTSLTYAGPAVVPPCVNEQAAFYTIGATATAATTFTVTATPVGSQTRDTRCGILTVNQIGAKTESGTASDPADCW